MHVVQMRMLRRMCAHTRRVKIQHEDIQSKVGVASVVEMIERSKIEFGHVEEMRGCTSEEVRKVG